MSRPETTAELRATIAELQERLRIESRRDKALANLKAYIKRRPLLTRQHVLDAARGMTAKRGDKAVQSELAAGARASLGKPNPKLTKPAKGKIGKAIRKARLAKNLSTPALAELVGITSASSISGYEAGKARPQEDVAAKLAAALGVSPKLFFNGDARPATH
jgi:DNA-binding transcriptional regulator YiaG